MLLRDWIDFISQKKFHFSGKVVVSKNPMLPEILKSFGVSEIKIVADSFAPT